MKGLRPPEEKNKQRTPLRLPVCPLPSSERKCCPSDAFFASAATTSAALAFLGIVACHLLLRDIVAGGVGGSVGGRDLSVSYGTVPYAPAPISIDRHQPSDRPRQRHLRDWTDVTFAAAPAPLSDNTYDDDYSRRSSPSLPVAAAPLNRRNASEVEVRVDYRAQRRRLQDAPPPPTNYGDCPVEWPVKPPHKIQTTYAASYPGCGARMSWNLIEALTGLWTGDDWNTNNRGKDVVTVKTHYPHNAGRLVEWDEEINRAFMIIRNPISAIPSFFNHIYEMKMHLPIHSQRAPVADWIAWRDKLLNGEIGLFSDFVRYWMNRFSDEHRIVLSYEKLTDDSTGGEEAVRLTEFLGRGEGVEPMTKMEDVPCVWHSVVKYKEHQHHQQQQLEPQQQQSRQLEQLIPEEQRQIEQQVEKMNPDQQQFQQRKQLAQDSWQQQQPQDPWRRRLEERGNDRVKDFHFDRWHRRLDPAHHDSQRSGPTERPYTKNQYEQIAEMLRNLAEEFVGHQMLHDLLKQYEYEVVEAARKQREKEKMISSETEGAPSLEGFLDISPEEGALPQQPPETAPNQLPQQPPPPGTTFDGRTFHIFQASPARTRSTVLTNFLMGLFEPDADYAFMVNRGEMPIKQRGEKVDVSATVVTKTHNTDLIMLYQQYKPMFSEVFFVSSSRGDDPNMRVPDEMCEYDNVLCLEYEELQFTNDEQLREVAKQLTNKFREKFAYFFEDGGVPSILWDWPTAVERLKAMDAVSRELAPEPFEVSDVKFGVHGGMTG